MTRLNNCDAQCMSQGIKTLVSGPFQRKYADFVLVDLLVFFSFWGCETHQRGYFLYS